MIPSNLYILANANEKCMVMGLREWVLTLPGNIKNFTNDLSITNNLVSSLVVSTMKTGNNQAINPAN